ncbi:MAG: hypothetical protein MN733_03335 [Nitrososphaera sp.]|nr:hypothetical protein [Nitrososphaera sp.]
MVEEVKGYLSSDGTFFKTPREAFKYEAEQALKSVLAQDEMSEDIIEWIARRKAHVTDYLKALETPGTPHERRSILNTKKPG